MSSLITTNSFDPTYPTFPALASIAIVLILLPAYWHFRSGNIGTILYIVWTFIGNLNYLINSISWAGNIHNPSWFWCDLSTAIIVALNVAVPTSSLLITHRLYSIAAIRQVTISKNDSRRAKYYEIALGVGLPVLAVIFRMVVQGHRFDIIENVGCWPSIYVTPVTVPMVFLPPILINLVSMVYALLAIRAFLEQRKQFSSVLQSADSGLTIGRYFCLMVLAATEVICSLPTSIYVMVTNLKTGIHPWISWTDTHLNFNRVEFMPFGWFKLYPRSWTLINLSRYMLPVGSFLFFVYLGMSGESGAFYRGQLRQLARLLGFPGPCENSPSASWVARPGLSALPKSPTLPPLAHTVAVASTTKQQRSSLDFYPNENRSKVSSSLDSLPIPPDFSDEEKAAVGHNYLSVGPPLAEVRPNVV